jgi:hypothetical protein
MATKTKTAKKAQEAPTGPICTVPGCDKPIYVRGLCEDHWNNPNA